MRQLSLDLSLDVLDVFRPVTVEAITTSTAAQMMATMMKRAMIFGSLHPSCSK